EFSKIQEAVAFAFPPPAIEGLGVSAGFEMRIQDRGDVGPETLAAITQEILADASTQSGLTGLNSTYRPGVPQLFVDIDREKVKRLQVPLTAVFDTLQAYLGSIYVNDFNKFGRTYQVRVQADHQYRITP